MSYCLMRFIVLASIVPLTIIVSTFSISPIVAQTVTLQDFESGALSDWASAYGPVEVKRIDVPADVTHDGVAGKMIEMSADNRAVLLAREDLRSPDFDRASAIRFRANAPDLQAGESLVFEFRAYSQVRPEVAFLLSRCEASEPGWETYELPLKWFRADNMAWMSWDEAGRYGFATRGAGRLLIDNIELINSANPNPAVLLPEDISQLAFEDRGRVETGDVFSIVTDCEELESAVLMRQLDRMFEMVRSDFPGLSEPDWPVILIVFAEEQDYKDFWIVLGDQYHADIEPPSAGGYTLFDLATSYYLEQYESVRPVFIHEALHALMTRVFKLGSNGNWIQEGLASHYQTEWSGQNLIGTIRRMIEADEVDSLSDLCGEGTLALNDYAEVALFVRWLLADERRHAGLIRLVADSGQRQSHELEPICEEYFGVPIDELETEWKQWLRGELAAREK